MLYSKKNNGHDTEVNICFRFYCKTTDTIQFNFFPSFKYTFITVEVVVVVFVVVVMYIVSVIASDLRA